MFGPGEQTQDASRVFGIGGLAQNLLSQGHGGVGAQNGRLRQTAPRMAGHGSIEFAGRHALHIVMGVFPCQLGLYGLGILGDVAGCIGQQQFMRHTQLLKQLTTAGTLGCKIEK